jgi:hypothetical protein
MYVSKKDRQLGFQRANSHRTGTVKSRVTTMSRVSSSKHVKGIKGKWSGRQLRTLNGFETHKATWKMQSKKSQDKPSICVLHYDWSIFGGVISATFPHETSCLAPVLEGGPG